VHERAAAEALAQEREALVDGAQQEVRAQRLQQVHLPDGPVFGAGRGHGERVRATSSGESSGASTSP
jgi:hypothetical protein